MDDDNPDADLVVDLPPVGMGIYTVQDVVVDGIIAAAAVCCNTNEVVAKVFDDGIDD